MKRILKWLGIILLALITGVFALLYYFASQTRGDGRIASTFGAVEYAVHRDTIRDNEMRWITTGGEDAKWSILFFHGAPGSWMDFSDYLTDSVLQSRTQMISIDRPGYGGSGYGHSETSIIEQARIAREITRQTPHRRLLVIGYSYGGPVAAAYAAQYGRSGDHLLLLAPVVHPEAERIFWFNSWLDTRLARWILPDMINVASDEKLSHADALRAMQHDWSRISIPTTHMHCTDDWIAPYYANAAWTQQQMSSELLTSVECTGDSHFLPNNVKTKVMPLILEVIGD